MGLLPYTGLKLGDILGLVEATGRCRLESRPHDQAGQPPALYVHRSELRAEPALPARDPAPTSSFSNRSMHTDPRFPPSEFTHEEWCGVRDALYAYDPQSLHRTWPQIAAKAMHIAGHYYGEAFSVVAHQSGRTTRKPHSARAPTATHHASCALIPDSPVFCLSDPVTLPRVTYSHFSPLLANIADPWVLLLSLSVSWRFVLC